MLVAEGTFRFLLEFSPVSLPVIGVTGGPCGFGGRGKPTIKVNDDWKVVRVKGDKRFPPGIDTKVGVGESEVW